MTTARPTEVDQAHGPSGRPPVTLVATLLTTALVGRLPQAMSALALVRIVLDSGGDYAAAGAVTSAYVIASTIGSPLLSRVVDRTGRTRTVLLAAALVSAGAFVGVVLVSRLGLVAALLLTIVAGVAAPPLEPVLRSLWPHLAAPGRPLQRVFAANTAVQEVLFILGPLVTAVSAAVLGAAGAVWAMAVLTVLGTTLFCAHRAVGTRAARRPGATRPGSALRSSTVRTLVVVLVGAGLPIGVLTITATRYAAEAGDGTLAGWALAVNAVGALVGAVAIARWRTPPDAARALPVLLIGLAVLSLPTALLGAPTALWLAFALISGLSLPPMLTQVFALVAQRVDADVATEANAWVVSAFNVGIGAGTFLAAAATAARGSAGTAGAVLGASTIAAAAGLVALTAARSVPAAPHVS